MSLFFNHVIPTALGEEFKTVSQLFKLSSVQKILSTNLPLNPLNLHSSTGGSQKEGRLFTKCSLSTRKYNSVNS
jgi:hypothetical protein